MEKKINILYVDDEPMNLMLFEINLERKYKVLLAENAFKGLEVLEANSDTMLIFSDMKMPKMNGIEFVEKAKLNFPNKKYFIITGFEITEEIQNALNSGLIDKYFRKPFNMGEIETAIEEELN